MGVDRYMAPSTVSPEAASQLTKLYARLARAPKREQPKTQEDWDRANARLSSIAMPISTATADALHVTRTEDHLGGVPILRVRPANYKAGGPTLVYMHVGPSSPRSASIGMRLANTPLTLIAISIRTADMTETRGSRAVER